jgi:myo-inositol-1(or 4)-monophosphatase
VDNPDADPAALVDLATRLAEDAGSFLLEQLHAERTLVETKSSLTDMVSEVDRASEARIVDALERERPDDGILGEEGTSRPGTSGVEWVIDPLDGTTSYLYAYPAFSVSIGVRHQGETVAAVVRDPTHRETFAAVRGGGATCNGVSISVSGLDDLSTALVGTGFGYGADRRAAQAAVLTHVLPRIRDIRRAGSAALDLCWVACGRLDAYYEYGLQPWDLAAGDLIVREAGGETSDLGGGTAHTDATVVAATPLVAPPLRALLRDAGASP